MPIRSHGTTHATKFALAEKKSMAKLRRIWRDVQASTNETGPVRRLPKSARK
jgi:hypothetical protein